MEPPKPEIRDQPATAPVVRREGGLAAVAKAMIEHPKDLRLQASVFFLGFGGAMVLHGTTGPTMNHAVAAANPEHVLVGYAMCTVGAALAFFTLSGAATLRRAAGRLEEALRGYFSYF